MTCKGLYLSKYIEIWEKFYETKLPSKITFYSKQNIKDISDHNHEQAQQFRNKITFELDNVFLRDYCYIFKSLENTCLKHYHLDTAHFYTTLGLAWQALLTPASEYCEHEVKCKEYELCPDQFKLQFLTNIDWCCWCLKKIFENGLLKWNAMLKTTISILRAIYHDETSTYFQYLDANDLYVWTKIQKLPAHGFALEQKNNCFTPERKINW